MMEMKHILLKNILVVSMAFLCLFTAYTSMANLQSSINAEAGTNSLAVVYASIVISCAFVPTWLISKLGEKKTMALSMLGYTLYILAQFYPSAYTLYPSAIVLGACAAPLWASKCTYLTQVARQYAVLTNQNPEIIVTRFFGIFFMFFQSSNIIGNLISSTVLALDADLVNITDTDRLSKCGSNYCTGDIENSVDLEDEVTNAQRYTMSTIYFIFSLVGAAIIALLLDPLDKFAHLDDGKNEKGSAQNPNENRSEKSTKKLLVATFSQMKDYNQLLIIPLTVFSGLEQGFFGATFTASYVGCGLGVHMIGYVMLCYGVADALSSVMYSPIVKMIGRVPVFMMGAVLDAGLLVVLFTWSPMPDQMWTFFVVAALWGLADAVWQTQINALYGILFPNSSESAFSNYRMWESIGFTISYILSGIVCTSVKLFVLSVSLVIGMIGYFTIEVLLRKQSALNSS